MLKRGGSGQASDVPSHYLRHRVDCTEVHNESEDCPLVLKEFPRLRDAESPVQAGPPLDLHWVFDGLHQTSPIKLTCYLLPLLLARMNLWGRDVIRHLLLRQQGTQGILKLLPDFSLTKLGERHTGTIPHRGKPWQDLIKGQPLGFLDHFPMVWHPNVPQLLNFPTLPFRVTWVLCWLTPSCHPRRLSPTPRSYPTPGSELCQGAQLLPLLFLHLQSKESSGPSLSAHATPAAQLSDWASQLCLCSFSFQPSYLPAFWTHPLPAIS